MNLYSVFDEVWLGRTDDAVERKLAFVDFGIESNSMRRCVLHHLSYGRTAKQIASLMQTSSVEVENLIEKIKSKRDLGNLRQSYLDDYCDRD